MAVETLMAVQDRLGEGSRPSRSTPRVVAPPAYDPLPYQPYQGPPRPFYARYSFYPRHEFDLFATANSNFNAPHTNPAPTHNVPVSGL